MTGRRHLPVLNASRASQPRATDAATDASDGPPLEETPAWHWVPLGMVATVLASAVLARLAWVPYARTTVTALGAHPSASAMASAQTRLALAGALVGVLGTLSGGLLVGALGNARVNPRHGLLAGGGAMILLGLLSNARMGAGGALAAALMVPIGALAGYLGALIALVAKSRATRAD
jgi:hypothetical protein